MKLMRARENNLKIKIKLTFMIPERTVIIGLQDKILLLLNKIYFSWIMIDI